MPKILCVDDVPDNLKLLGSDLEDEGFEVVTASDGALALEELDRTDFSAVILDWMMPASRESKRSNESVSSTRTSSFRHHGHRAQRD